MEYAGPKLRVLRNEPPDPDDLLSPEAYSKKYAALGKETLCGHVTDPRGNPLASASVQLTRPQVEPFQLQFFDGYTTSRSDGSFCVTAYSRGDYILTGELKDEDGTRWVGYYPGTANRDEAKPIGLEHGDSLKDIDFSLQLQPQYTVVFQLKTSDGNPPPPPRQIELAIEGSPKDALSYSGGKLFDPDGTITFNNVPPGHYLVRADENPQYVPDSDQEPSYGLVQLETDVKGNDTIVVTITPKPKH